MAQSCAERGYEATTPTEIAAAAGCSLQDFSRYFASKDECALAAVEWILSESLAGVGKAWAPDRSEWESVLSALSALLELFAARPPFARLALIESRQGMDAVALQRYESGIGILTAMLDRLREGSDISIPPGASRAAIGGGEALVRQELAWGRGKRLPEALPALVYTATVPFLGQREALRLTQAARRTLAGQRASENRV
jgi:AcrR family transcriptional regulator